MARTMPTGEISSAGSQAITGPCVLHGVLLISDGTNDPKLIIHDNTSAAGTVVGEYAFDCAATDGVGNLVKYFPLPEVVCWNGAYGTLTGTNATYILYFESVGELGS